MDAPCSTTYTINIPMPKKQNIQNIETYPSILISHNILRQKETNMNLNNVADSDNEIVFNYGKQPLNKPERRKNYLLFKLIVIDLITLQFV